MLLIGTWQGPEHCAWPASLIFVIFGEFSGILGKWYLNVLLLRLITIIYHAGWPPHFCDFRGILGNCMWFSGTCCYFWGFYWWTMLILCCFCCWLMVCSCFLHYRNPQAMMYRKPLYDTRTVLICYDLSVCLNISIRLDFTWVFHEVFWYLSWGYPAYNVAVDITTRIIASPRCTQKLRLTPFSGKLKHI